MISPFASSGSNILFFQPIQQRAPTESIIVASPFTPRPSTSLKSIKNLQRVVKVQFRPGNLKTFDDSIMAVQKFPSGSGAAPGGRADDGIADDTIGVRDKGDVVAQVVAGIVFGAGKYQGSGDNG